MEKNKGVGVQGDLNLNFESRAHLLCELQTFILQISFLSRNYQRMLSDLLEHVAVYASITVITVFIDFSWTVLSFTAYRA